MNATIVMDTAGPTAPEVRSAPSLYSVAAAAAVARERRRRAASQLRVAHTRDQIHNTIIKTVFVTTHKSVQLSILH